MPLKVSDEEYAALRAKTGVTSGVTLAAGEKKANKYSARAVVLDGMRFDSKDEGARYNELKLMAQAGLIAHLKVHPRYAIDINGVHVCDYVADFCYCDQGVMVVEDVKGVPTPVYKLKRRLMVAVHGVRVKEVRMK